MFAYTIKAELNNDGSYKVTLFDVGSDECSIETVLPKARIMIDTLSDSYQDSMKPMLDCPFEGSDIVCDDGALGFDGSVKQCPTAVFNKCQKGF